jgi:hypothetical protein
MLLIRRYFDRKVLNDDRLRDIQILISKIKVVIDDVDEDLPDLEPNDEIDEDRPDLEDRAVSCHLGCDRNDMRMCGWITITREAR